jgi:hypothetical protein
LPLHLSIVAHGSKGRGALSRWLEHLTQNLVPWTKGLRTALVHHEYHIHARKRARPVSNYDRNPAAATNSLDRMGQSRLPLSVKVRIWLVKNDEEGVTV